MLAEAAGGVPDARLEQSRTVKYIHQDKDGVWQFEPYLDHLNSIKSRIPDKLLGLICDVDRYGLDSRASFHDAWLRTLTVFGPQECELEDVYKIHMSLLGAWHDRLFELTYRGVKSYKIESGISSRGLPRIEYLGQERHMDDLIVHEFDVLPAGVIEHRLLFASRMTVSIACADIDFEEKPLQI